MRLFFNCSVFIALLCISCNNATDGVYKLKVVVPFSYHSYIDFVGITNDYPELIEYDTIQKKIVYVFDSISTPEATLTFFSLLTDDYKRTIQLNKDTTIIFASNLYSNFIHDDAENIFNIKLDSKDTLYIGEQSHGCSSFTQKIKIFKTDTIYYIYISTFGTQIETVEYTLPQETFTTLFKTYLEDCHKLFPAPTVEMIMLQSTISSSIYMREGNTIYTLPDPVRWDGLDTFKKAVIDTDQKNDTTENNWDTLFVK